MKKMSFYMPHCTIKRLSCAVGFALLISLTVSVGCLHAGQEDQTHSKVISVSIDDVKKHMETVGQRLAAARQAETQSLTQKNGTPFEKLSENTEKLEAIQAVLERLINALHIQQSQIENISVLTEKLRQQETDIRSKSPYNLSFYDEHLEKQAIVSEQTSASKMAANLSKKTMEALTEQIKVVEKNWRSLNEQLNKSSDADEHALKRHEMTMQELEEEYLRALLQYETVNLENTSHQVTLQEQASESTRRNVEWIAQNLQYDKTDLAKQIAAIQEKQKEYELKLEPLILRSEKADASLQSIRKSISAAAEGSQTDVLEAKAAARQAWFETHQVTLEITGAMLQLLLEQKNLWQIRYRLLKENFEPADRETDRLRIQELLQEWFKRISLEQQHINAIRSRIAALDRQIDDDTLADVIEQQLKSEVDALRQLYEERSAYTSLLLANQQLARRTMAELAPKTELVGFTQKILSWYHHINDIWEVEIWVIDNNPVTVREIAVALFVLIVGLAIAKILLRALMKRLFAITNIKQTTAATIQKIITYFTYLLVALFAMRMVNIPLAAFAFLGGAIAIGLGFGAQNLINNFISGFIMLAERPISLSDLIEIEGVVGQVEEIGARCTRIRTGENIHILVPNSTFLEKNITNWTLSDHKIRTNVRVGVIYGSPVPETRRLLLKAVQENDRVIKTPEPFVLFQDFGDNALIFDVFFWIQVNKIIERRTIESSVRFSIDDLFRKAGLVIAFPQQDVHLDTQKPLELKWVNGASPDTVSGDATSKTL